MAQAIDWGKGYCGLAGWIGPRSAWLGWLMRKNDASAMIATKAQHVRGVLKTLVRRGCWSLIGSVCVVVVLIQQPTAISEKCIEPVTQRRRSICV